MNFIDDGTDNVDYEKISRTILDWSVTNMSLVVSKGDFGDIYAKDTQCHGYYIIKFTSTSHTLQ